MPPGSPITGFDKLAAGQRIGVVQGTVQEAYVVDTLHLDPVKFPDYNTVYASLKTRQIDAWVAPSQQALGTVQARRPRRRSSKTPSAWTISSPTRSPRRTQPLIDALNSGLDAVIADGTWSQLYSDWVPRALPPGWKPGSKAAPAPQLPDFAAIAASKRSPAPTTLRHAEIHTGAAAATRSSTGTSTSRRSPTCSRPACPTRLILTVSASVIGLVLGMVLAVAGISRAPLAALAGTGLHRHLPRSARGGDHPDRSAWASARSSAG